MSESPLTIWRKKAGFTQADIAKLANVSQAHVSEVECGVTELCERIAGFLERIAQRGSADVAREAGQVAEKQAEFFKGEQSGKHSESLHPACDLCTSAVKDFTVPDEGKGAEK